MKAISKKVDHETKALVFPGGDPGSIIENKEIDQVVLQLKNSL